MTDFGGKLREARERRGIPLRQIATTTKISITALEALERNDTSKLPGGIFSRAFVRSYAMEVGLDPEETVREFLDRFHGEPPVSSTAPTRIPDEELAFERRKHLAAVVFVVAVAVMLILSAVVLFVVLRDRPDSVDALVPDGTGFPVVSAAPDGPTATPPAAGEASVAAAGSQARPAEGASTLRLELYPSGPCWISATVDGRRVLSRTMLAGERETFEIREQATITVGDAGAFAFSIDGREGRPLGAPGSVATARITRETVDQYLR